MGDNSLAKTHGLSPCTGGQTMVYYYLTTNRLLSIHKLRNKRSCGKNGKEQAKQRNPIALRKAKIVYNFGLSECNRVKKCHYN